jgi:hypothetical protein
MFAASALVVLPASADTYYWTGDNATSNAWNATTGVGGTNWSLSPDFNNGSPGLPGASDDVFFYFNPSPKPANLNNVLGQDFSIRSLTFTSDSTSVVTIGGSNLLTLGAGGLTVQQGAAAHVINTNVALGTSQTWANNSTNVLTVNGVVSGAAANGLTIAGIAGSGGIRFTNANTYSGSTTVFTGTLTLSGANGSILNTSSITLGAGTTLNLDSASAGNNNNRIASGAPITSNGGFINLLGNSSQNTSQTVGTLGVASGATYVTVTPGGSQTATLTFGAAGTIPSLNHSVGGTVTFSSTGNINVPNVTLVNPTNAIIGGYATIGTTTSTSANNLDWATVNGAGRIVPLATYQPLTANPAATDNAQVTANTTTPAVTLAGSASNTYTVNTLAFNGANFAMNFTNNTDLLTIGSGGILSTNATGTGNYDNKDATPNMTFVGSPDSGVLNTGGTVAYNGHITSSFVTSATTSELDVFTAANGSLRLYSIIDDPDATHKLWLVKSGPGLLDLSGGNTQNNKTNNTFTGNVVINEGILLINTAGNLGNPAGGQANTVIFNGGELRTFAGLSTTAANGWTVGTRGGTFTYTGGGTSNIQNKITGVGGFTYYSRAFGGGTNELLNLANAAGNNDYQGPTNIWISLATDQTQFGRVAWTQNNQIPATSAVTLSVVDDTAAHTQVTNAIGSGANAGNPASADLGGHSDHFGSLAGNLNMRNFTGTLTIGANNLSTVYSGSIYGTATQAGQGDVVNTITAGTGTLVKVGTGTQTFAGTLNN